MEREPREVIGDTTPGLQKRPPDYQLKEDGIIKPYSNEPSTALIPGHPRLGCLAVRLAASRCPCLRPASVCPCVCLCARGPISRAVGKGTCPLPPFTGGGSGVLRDRQLCEGRQREKVCGHLGGAEQRPVLLRMGGVVSSRHRIRQRTGDSGRVDSGW